ncbi:MAG: hypothetical protein HC763_25245, partial [Hydrococcus sp. CRU_1_1]|nr:hypothetical protein [Hydrococcus sp. CRU_1_1]
MTEPHNFTSTEQFQDVNKRIWNQLIREYFRDVSASDDNLDLTTPRQALLKACLHSEDDSLLLTIGRMNLFLHATTYLTDWGYDLPVGNIGSSSAGCLVGRTRKGHREFMSLVKSDRSYRE